MKLNLLRIRQRRRRGAATVELAMVAPVVLFLVFGAVEFSRMLMVRQAMTNAIREGCRNATLITTRTSSDAETIVRAKLAKVLPDTAEENLVVSLTPSFNSPPSSNTAIVATASIQCSDVSWIPSSFFAGAQIRCSASMNRE